MTGTTTLVCPKCRGEMRTYERNGVLVDQCEECRGIFLDRGELEQLLNTEHGREQFDDDREGREHGERRHRHGEDRDHERGGRRSATSLLSDLLGGGE
jgi:uncharacterized protein